MSDLLKLWIILTLITLITLCSIIFGLTLRIQGLNQEVKEKQEIIETITKGQVIGYRVTPSVKGVSMGIGTGTSGKSTGYSVGKSKVEGYHYYIRYYRPVKQEDIDRK